MSAITTDDAATALNFLLRVGTAAADASDSDRLKRAMPIAAVAVEAVIAMLRVRSAKPEDVIAELRELRGEVTDIGEADVAAIVDAAVTPSTGSASRPQ